MRCPFCGNKLTRHAGGNPTCEVCGIVVYEREKKVKLLSCADEYIKESAKFVDMCKTYHPNFVMSKRHPWTTQFKSDDTVFIYSDRKRGDIPDDLVANGYKLIAGLGHFIDSAFVEACAKECKLSNGRISNWPDSADYMYDKLTIYQQVVDLYNEDIQRKLNIIYAPNTEVLLYWCLPSIRGSIVLHSATRESILYSMLFCDQHHDILNTDGSLRAASLGCAAFTFELVNNDMSEQVKMLKRLGLSDVYIDNLIRLYLMSEPYLAVNNSCDSELCTYDISYDDCVDDVLSELDWDECTKEDVEHKKKYYELKRDLFDVYAGYSRDMGVTYKESIVGQKSSVNETVQSFWKHIYTELNGGRLW